MSYRSNRPAVRALLDRATDAGLLAAASVVQREVKRRIAPGYTTGEYVTGTALNNVIVSRPATEGLARVIRVGAPAMARNRETGETESLMYILHWELGWRPAFGARVYDAETDRGSLVQDAGPRRLLRKEIWRPSLFDTRVAQQREFVGAFRGAWFGAPVVRPTSEAAD